MGWLLIVFGFVLIGFVLWPKRGGNTGTTEGQISNLRGDADKGTITAKIDTIRTNANLDLATTKNQLAQQLVELQTKQRDAKIAEIDTDMATHEAVLKHELLDETHKTQSAQERLNQQLIGKASENDIDVTTYLAIEEKRQFNKADLDNELSRMREEVRLAIIAKHLSDVQKISLVQEQIDSIYNQVYQIDQTAPLSVKDRMIADREEIILTLKETRRGIETGLLEAHNRGEIPGDSEAPEFSGDLGQTVEGASDQLSVKRGRGRPKGSPNKRGRES